MARNSPARLCAGVRRWLSGPWRLLRRTAHGFSEDGGSLLAAAMAFYAFLAIFPFVLVLIAGLGYFLGSSETAFAKVSGYLSRTMPELSAQIQTQLKQIILHRTVVGGLSLLAVIWSSSGVFGVLQAALTQIWEVPRRPRFVVARLKSLGFVLSAVLLLVASVAMRPVAVVLGRLPLSRVSGAVREFVPLWDPSVGVVSLIFGFAMFMALYSIVSSPVVRRRDMALGAGFAAVAWELAKVGFAWYVETYAAFDRVYGPMGTVVILLLWIYVSCLILVVGAELAWARSKQAGEAAGPVQQPAE